MHRRRLAAFAEQPVPGGNAAAEGTQRAQRSEFHTDRGIECVWHGALRLQKSGLATGGSSQGCVDRCDKVEAWGRHDALKLRATEGENARRRTGKPTQNRQRGGRHQKREGARRPRPPSAWRRSLPRNRRPSSSGRWSAGPAARLSRWDGHGGWPPQRTVTGRSSGIRYGTLSRPRPQSRPRVDAGHDSEVSGTLTTFRSASRNSATVMSSCRPRIRTTPSGMGSTCSAARIAAIPAS